MRVPFGIVTLVGVLASSLGCSSTPIDDGAAGGTGNTGGSQSTDTPSSCSGALRQTLSLVDAVSTGAVSVLMEAPLERTIYVDASAGGINGQDQNPWVYVSLAAGQAVRLTDIEALVSRNWDLAFKRFIVRTNSGDSGPGHGGAIRVNLPWDSVDVSTLGQQMLPRESWFDADCNLKVDENMELITTFTGWSQYDEVKHVLAPADVVFITAGADGALYKVAILDYYSTPTGAQGSLQTQSGHYKVRVAPLQ
jgi:hypothetical protein